MKINVGMFDRVIRVWLGIGLLLFAVFSPDTPFSWIGWIGIIPLVTGLLGRCGLYSFLGISTVKNNASE